jgi:hypothetical protein
MMIRRGLDGIVEVTRDNLDRAFAELAISVNDAFSKAWKDLPPVGTVESDRERYAVALWCVALFFSRFGAPFADRFFELGSAITDLNLRIPSDLLKCRRFDRRRPPDNSQKKRARARVVLGLHALRRSGLSQSEAANKIAHDFPVLKELINQKQRKDKAPKTDLPQSIVDLSKKLASWANDEASMFYQLGKEAVEAMAVPVSGPFAQVIVFKGSNPFLTTFANAQLAAAAKFCSASIDQRKKRELDEQAMMQRQRVGLKKTSTAPPPRNARGRFRY